VPVIRIVDRVGPAGVFGVAAIQRFFPLRFIASMTALS
jgi:hypothetical protein